MHAKPPPTWAKGDGERDSVTAAESRPRRRHFRILLQTRIRGVWTEDWNIPLRLAYKEAYKEA